MEGDHCRGFSFQKILICATSLPLYNPNDDSEFDPGFLIQDLRRRATGGLPVMLLDWRASGLDLDGLDLAGVDRAPHWTGSDAPGAPVAIPNLEKYGIKVL